MEAPAERVMMEIEIKFSKGRVDRVLVHHGDHPTALAKVRGHSLSRSRRSHSASIPP
jgi:hypothetical protein